MELVLNLRLRSAKKVVIKSWDPLLEDSLNVCVLGLTRLGDVDVSTTGGVGWALVAGIVASSSSNWASWKSSVLSYD